MTRLRKISALVLAVMMIAVVGLAYGSSVPETMTSTNGVIGAFSAADTPDSAKNSSLVIYQEITAYNKDGKTVNAPTVTYTYTITGLNGGKTVKDAGGTSLHGSGQPLTVITKDARSATIGAATITGTGTGVLALTPADQLTASDNGTANRFPLTIDFSGCTWTGAGVYRFKIDETTIAAEKLAAGIKEGTTTNTRYIDVYVKDAASGGYEIYGYTCLSADVNIDGTDSTSVAAAGKTEGFVGSQPDDGAYSSENDSVADRYYTFNLTVGKTLSGDSFSNDHDFPFTVKFANASVTKAITIKLELSENGGTATSNTLSGTLSTATTGITDTNRGIDHQSTVMYVGIPVGISAATSAEVYEVNNVTGTMYLSQYSVQGATLTGDKKIDWTTGSTSTSNTATMTAITADADDNVSHTIQFTNTLELISPTGYVSRFAPYALILIGGVALLVIAMKKRKHTEED